LAGDVRGTRLKMATVTTTNVPAPRIRPFEKSINPTAPFGELLFTGTFTVPTKDAANESQIIISSTMPGNYVYRLQAIEVFMQSVGTNEFADIELAWSAVLTENQVTTRRFPLYNVIDFLSASQQIAIKVDPDATTNDFGTWYMPPEVFLNLGGQLINASSGVSILTLQLMDTSSDATAALVITFRILASVYTIQQYNAAPINTPVWDT